MSTYPVVYQQNPPVERSRLTIFFRSFIVIPHYIWAIFYGFAAFVVAAIAWFAIMFTGRYPAGMYEFMAGYLRFSIRLSAYGFLICDVYPPFDGGEHPEYPVVVSVAPPPEKLSRLTTFFRFILIIPVAIIEYVFLIWLYLIAIALWFVGVIVGQTSPGLTGATAFPMAYFTRASAYSLYMTDGWPPFED